MLSSRIPADTPSQTQSSLLSELDSVYELQSEFSSTAFDRESEAQVDCR